MTIFSRLHLARFVRPGCCVGLGERSRICADEHRDHQDCGQDAHSFIKAVLCPD